MKIEYSDAEIIAMIQESTASRELALAYIYQKESIRKKAFAKIRSMIQDISLGNDIFLDSLLAFVKNVKYNKFRGESAISTYIVAICNFQCLVALKKLKKEQIKSDQYLSDQKLMSQNEEHPEFQFLELEESRYEAKLKRKIWKLLSPGCRETIRNKYGKNLSVKDIASLKDIAEQSVKNTLSRCYQKLRDFINKDPEAMKVIKGNYGRL